MMTKKKLALVIAVSVGVIAALGAVGTFAQSAFSSADTAVSSSTLAQSEPAMGEPGASAGPDEVEAAPPVMEQAACDFDEWVGKTADEAEALAKATGRPYRVIKPGQPVTMDYSPDRINVEISDDGIVIRVHCA